MTGNFSKPETAQAIYHTAPGQVCLERLALTQPQASQLLIKTECSAISPGTESLIFQGRFPAQQKQDAIISSLQGGFDYPFRYGYALAGEVIAVGDQTNADWLQRKVFAFHPHQDYALVSDQDCQLLPDDIDPLSAVLLPSVESALNFVMDAAPRIGEHVLIFGQGVLGLLTTALLADYPLSSLVTIDPQDYRRMHSITLGASRTIDPESTALEDLQTSLPDGFDLTFELSGKPQGLNKAIELTGFSGRILIGSWYGNSQQQIDLGGSFHRKRIRLLSSQVSTIDPLLSGRWDKARRIALAWDMIRKLQPQQLISHRYPIQQCQQAFEQVSQYKDNVLQVVFEY